MVLYKNTITGKNKQERLKRGERKDHISIKLGYLIIIQFIYTALLPDFHKKT